VYGASRIDSFRWTAAFYAALWSAAFFWMLRLLGCRLPDAIIFTGLANVSAAAVFWTPVPEFFVLGALTLLAPLGAVLADHAAPGLAVRTTLASAVSLSVTFTNWLAGIAAAFLVTTRVRAFQWSVNAFVIVSVLWIAQAAWFPHAEFLLGNARAIDYLERLPEPVFTEALMVFFLHSMIMPAVAPIGPTEGLSIQSVSTAWPWSLLWLLWLSLLLAGSRQLFLGPAPSSFRVLLSCVVAGQLFLHLLIGRETFLFSMHSMPLLVLVAACATLGRARIVALALATILTGGAALNNWQQFQGAAQHVATAAATVVKDDAVFTDSVDCLSQMPP